METRDYTAKTGKIKRFKLEEEMKNMVRLNNDKPSARIIKSKRGKKAIAGLIDIEANHNHSWYCEILNRSKKNPNALAIFYRGTKISFREMLEKADTIAKSLVSLGVKAGDEIPACLSNTPEAVYYLLALNKIGAKVNLISSNLNEDYLTSILNSCSKKVFIGTDDTYSNIENIVNTIDYENIVLNSLADSLPEDPTKCDEYEPKLDKYYHYENKVNKYASRNPKIISFNEMYNIGLNSNVDVIDNNDLDTEFLISYTSGSTKIGHPSQLVHTNRSLIVSGRFHDSELSGNPDLIGLRGMAHIHMDSNTNIITCISDNLMQLWAVAMEPEYSKETALDAIFMNKPSYLNMTTSHLISAFKEYLVDKKFHEVGTGRKMPWLFACFAVGENASPGEEKFINRGLREARAGSGVKIKGLSLPFTTLCVGGGDCEHGGIYYTLWKALYDKVNYFRLKNHVTGLMPEAYVQISAFKKSYDGRYVECDYNECGIIASNSATTMSHYKNEPKKTSDIILTDEHGRDWISNNVYGYIDNAGGVHVKGRLGNEVRLGEHLIPPFIIEDVVNKDTKNILSCSVNRTSKEETVVNIEFQPFKKALDSDVIKSIIDRFYSKYGIDISNMVYFRIISNENGFPLTGSGKRSIPALEKMELSNTFRYDYRPQKEYIKDSDVKKLQKKLNNI